MKVYEPLNKPDETTGKFYKEFDIPENIPLNGTLLKDAPPENMDFPKWNYMTSLWEEDKDSIISKQTQTIKDLAERLDTSEKALMESVGLISSLGGQ